MIQNTKADVEYFLLVRIIGLVNEGRCLNKLVTRCVLITDTPQKRP